MLTDDLITPRIRESIEVKQGLLQYGKTIKDISKVILKAYRTKKKVILFGNVGVLRMLNTSLLSFQADFVLTDLVCPLLL